MENTTLHPDQLKELRNAVSQLDRPYIGLTDLDLLNEIENQSAVVYDCIFFAKKVAKDEKPDSVEKLEGLYFAFYRYEQLTNELAERFNPFETEKKNSK